MLKILKIILWIIIPISIVVVGLLAQNYYYNTKVKALNIEINYNKNGESNRFLTYDDINTFISHRYDSIIGKKIQYINIEDIESDLLEMPYIKSADAYITLEGNIELRINQRKAIIRVIDAMGDQFYLDDQARILPIRSFFPARVPICNGYVGNFRYYSKDYSNAELDSIVQNSMLKEIYLMAKYIESDTMLRSQIVQFNVDINGEFILVPLVSNHIIKFGKAENIERKFEKLKIFYTKGLGHHRWNNYRVLNLKYKNQIVCTKN